MAPPPKPAWVRERALTLARDMSAEDASKQLQREGVAVAAITIRGWVKAQGPTPPTPPSPGTPPVAHGDVLPLVRRILGARAPAAAMELEMGLVEAAKGEAALAAWLTRPIAAAETLDPLDTALVALSRVTGYVQTLPPDHPRAATILGAAANLAKTVEKINQGRPREVSVDEVTERINARRDEAVRKILEHTAEARARLAADRKELAGWATANLGPVLGPEIVRRLDEMLGGAQ